MRQLLQSLRDGRTVLTDVPSVGDSRGNVLIRACRSLVSAGTERMLVDFGKSGWLGKARAQPEKVRAVLNKVRAEGAIATWQAVRAKLDQPIPLGYCNVGVVAGGDEVNSRMVKSSNGTADAQVEELASSETDAVSSFGLSTTPPLDHSTGDAIGFAPGDRVVSNGPHAEVVSVSKKLCARIPDSVNDDAATFTPLAAIAWEGIGLMNVSAGDKVIVTGLGLIGQLAVRILRACGCDVLGIDPAADRRALAEQHGATTVPADSDPVSAALSWTKGEGVAGVLITASTSSNAVISHAARSCRYRGKVVLVGVVGLQLNRADFYRNEVSFQVSCSYGRRDHTGPGSVRANFERVLGWMAEGKLPVEDLITHRFAFENAPAAYEKLADRSALGILLEYGGRRTDDRGRSQARIEQEVTEGTEGSEQGLLAVNGELGMVNSSAQSPITKHQSRGSLFSRTITLREASAKNGVPRVALIGAGNFAGRTLLPALAKIEPAPTLSTVVSNQGASAYILAEKFGARRASTDEGVVYSDPEIDAVFITTRHDNHAEQTLTTFQAGKHVWVEKPLCLTLEELRALERAVSGAGNRSLETNRATSPTLMVGFNRRFAPMAVKLREASRNRGGVLELRMTINAGRIDPDHWTLNPKSGGGRIVGEACHFIDLSRYLIGQPISEVRCTRRDEDGQDGGCFELGFASGARATIDYRTDLPPHVPKELIQASGQGWTATIHNWATLTSSGLNGLKIGSRWSRSPKKGHPEALKAFLGAVGGGATPVPADEIFEVSRWAIVMQGMRVGDVVNRDW